MIDLEKLAPMPEPKGTTRFTMSDGSPELSGQYTAAQMAALREQVAWEVAKRCAEICERISDEYQRSEGRRYPEMKTDAEQGSSACMSAIAAEFGLEGV